MRSLRKMSAVFAATLAMAALSSLAQAQVTVNIYSGFTDVGGGAPYSGLVGSFQSPDIQFGINTGFDWHPFGLFAFGADLLGDFDVAADGDYTFSLFSDDGSLLFIDGNLVIDNGGGHGPNLVAGSATLTQGIHAFEVQFFEDFGGASGLDLFIPDGVSFVGAAVPEPGAMAFLSCLALSGIGLIRRKRR